MSIWVPPSAQPKARCRICNKPFYRREGPAMIRHVKECATAYAETESVRKRAPGLYDPDPDVSIFDREYEAYVKRTGKL